MCVQPCFRRQRAGRYTVISEPRLFTGHPALLLESWFSLCPPSLTSLSLLTPPLPSFSSSRLCPPHEPSLLSSRLLSQLSRWLSRPQPPLRVPQHLQTVTQLSYHNIMRLRAPKLKEAIFYSCQLIIEGGPTYSNTSKGSGGKRDGGDGREWLWSERGAEGGGGRGAALHFECFLLLPSQSFSLWYFSLVTRAALKSKSSFHQVPLNILKSNM